MGDTTHCEQQELQLASPHWQPKRAGLNQPRPPRADDANRAGTHLHSSAVAEQLQRDSELERAIAGRSVQLPAARNLGRAGR